MNKFPVNRRCWNLNEKRQNAYYTFIDRSRCHYLQQTALIMVKVTYHKCKILAMIYILKFLQSAYSTKSLNNQRVCVSSSTPASAACTFK